MIRMLIIGYCFGIRSERRLCDDVHLWSSQDFEDSDGNRALPEEAPLCLVPERR
jgi:hypothetical protein